MSAQDLFIWREEADAAERVAQAEEIRAAAERARRYAPHGELRARQAKLEEATRAALRAELQHQAVQRKGRSS